MTLLDFRDWSASYLFNVFRWASGSSSGAPITTVLITFHSLIFINDCGSFKETSTIDVGIWTKIVGISRFPYFFNFIKTKVKLMLYRYGIILHSDWEFQRASPLVELEIGKPCKALRVNNQSILIWFCTAPAQWQSLTWHLQYSPFSSTIRPWDYWLVCKITVSFFAF